MEAWSRQTGHPLIAQEQDGDKFIFYFRRGK
jgi:hypothetical protein